jgi:hypothetical protein
MIPLSILTEFLFKNSQVKTDVEAFCSQRSQKWHQKVLKSLTSEESLASMPVPPVLGNEPSYQAYTDAQSLRSSQQTYIPGSLS